MHAWLKAVEYMIATQWEHVGKAPTAFHEICQQALSAAPPPTDRATFLASLLRLDYPKQGYSQNEFGNVAVTVLRNADFRIDVYIWNGSVDTCIHDHHFMGAYRPLYGRSRQFSFSFTPTRTIDSALTEGRLIHSDTRLVSPGDAATIPLGEDLIHLVHHMDTPTITVCVRTDDMPGRQLRQYFFPGYRLLYNQFRTSAQKRLKVLQVMAHAQLPPREALIAPVLEELTLAECFLLLAQADKYMAHFPAPFKDVFAKAVYEHIKRLFPALLFMPVQHSHAISEVMALDEPR